MCQKWKTILIIVIIYNFMFLIKCSNIVLFLTDDQDMLLNGMLPLEKTRRIFNHGGVDFKNAFVTTPLCCPSRASILTGRFLHSHLVVNNTVEGNCNSRWWQEHEEPYAFVRALRNHTTFFAGKYLNQYGNPHTGGSSHIPPGWDHWIGLVGNSRYYNYSLSINGSIHTYGDSPRDYLTNVLTEKAVDFIQHISSPFFMMLAPPAPHSPWTPHPKYWGRYSGHVAPRVPNFNVYSSTKHWLVRSVPEPLDSEAIDSVDTVYCRRLETLLSVDDMVDQVYQALDRHNLLKDTYLFFTSDNGYHMGQFAMPWDKRLPYETDIRVPLLVSVPGMGHVALVTEPVLNVDLAPTFLELAGADSSEFLMEGRSLVPWWVDDGDPSAWRSHFLVEYSGEGRPGPVDGCPQYSAGGVEHCEFECRCQDATNNSYICLRTLDSRTNSITCTFLDSEGFKEEYNLADDPYQLHNLAEDVVAQAV